MSVRRIELDDSEQTSTDECNDGWDQHGLDRRWSDFYPKEDGAYSYGQEASGKRRRSGFNACLDARGERVPGRLLPVGSVLLVGLQPA
jgi:hypothetical protein